MSKRPPCGLHCIKINNIGVKDGKKIILEDVSIHIHCGELTVIIGQNGAGKSTLLRALLGEIHHSGEIVFTDKASDVVRKLKIGYVPQTINVDKSTPATVYDVIASYTCRKPVFLYKDKNQYNTIRNQLALFDAARLIDQPIGNLSGGELQRVLLTIATMPEPDLLILDEPVSGIDRTGMELFYHNVGRLKTEFDMAVILVSHDLEFAARYADKVILLDKTVKKAGTPEEVFNSPQFSRIFGNISVTTTDASELA